MFSFKFLVCQYIDRPLRPANLQKNIKTSGPQRNPFRPSPITNWTPNSKHTYVNTVFGLAIQALEMGDVFLPQNQRNNKSACWGCQPLSFLCLSQSSSIIMTAL
jgi:hypothetical protein